MILKLVVTPALIGAASVAGRRWGQVVSGWMVGLPLTSGPVAFFLVLFFALGLLIGQVGTTLAFGAAIVAALALQAGSFRVITSTAVEPSGDRR